LLGAVNFGMAGIISPIVGVLGVSNAIPMGAVMVGTSLIAVLSLWFLVRPRTVPPLTN
jgi:MFS transporter, DHA1 family, multidrug resistance protein